MVTDYVCSSGSSYRETIEVMAREGKCCPTWIYRYSMLQMASWNKWAEDTGVRKFAAAGTAAPDDTRFGSALYANGWFPGRVGRILAACVILWLLLSLIGWGFLPIVEKKGPRPPIGRRRFRRKSNRGGGMSSCGCRVTSLLV